MVIATARISLMALAILSLMAFVFCESTQSPFQYFKGRNTFSKHLKRNPESKPFLVRANQKIKSSQEYDFQKYSRMTPVDDMFMFDGVVNFDTVNIDYHPYVVDVGCTENKMYIRLDESQVADYAKQFQAGSVIVSSKYGFTCTKLGLGSSKPIDTPMDLSTKTIGLKDIISKLSFHLHKNPTERKTTTTSKRWTIGGIKIPLPTWQWNTEGNFDGPAKEQFIKTFDDIGSVGCTDCYAVLGVGFTFQLSFYYILPYAVEGTVTYDTMAKSVVNGKIFRKDFPLNYQIVPEQDLFTLQEIWVIPVRFNLRGKVILDFTANAEVDIDVRIGARVTGSLWFRLAWEEAWANFKADPPVIKPDLGYSYNKIEGEVSTKLTTGITLSIFSLFNMEVEFVPQANLIATTVLRPDCLLGLDFKAGLTGGLKIHEWALGSLKVDQINFPFDFLPVARVPYLSDICIHPASGRRELMSSLESSEIEMVQSSQCCSVALNNTGNIVGAIVTIPAENYDFYDSIILKLGYTKSCVIQIGNKTITSSSDSVQIQLSDLVDAKTSDIKLIFQKDIKEIVTVDYSYSKSSLVLGQETKVKSGLVILDIQQTLPELLVVRVSGGVLTTQKGEIVPENIDTSKETFPLIWYFDSDSNGTITVYPFYKANSGASVSNLILKKLRFGLIYTGNSMPSFSLDSLQLYTSSMAKAQEDSLDMTLKVITLSDAKASDIYAMANPVISKDQGFSTKFGTIPKYVVFDISANVNCYFKYELLELYSKYVNSLVSINYEAISPFALAITHDSTWAKSGLIITVGQNTLSYADISIVTEKSKSSTPFIITSKDKASFGFSKYSMSEWIGKKFYIRMEPTQTTSAKRSGYAASAGSISLDRLQNENITVSVKFSREGKQYDSISLNSLTSDHKYYLSIIINDPQYTFNEFSLSTVSFFVKFLNTIRTTKTDSKWNTVILPLLSFQASTSSSFDFKVVSPQEVQVKLPIYPTLEASTFTESVTFTNIDTTAFSPSPRGVSTTSSISVTGDNKLTGGDIGSIIASVVGFSIIVSLIVALIIVVVVCLLKKKDTSKDLEMSENKK